MSIIGDIENRLLDRLKQFFAPVLSPLTKLWNILKGFFTAIVEVVPETIDLVKLIYSEVLAWKSFREELHFKTGVINLQSAKDRILDLVDEIVTGWHSLVDLFSGGFKLSLKPLQDAEEAAAELVDLFDGLGELGILEWLQKLGPKIEKAGGKIFEVLAIIQAVAEELLKVVRELHDIVQAAKDIRETFQTGEGLFLSQSNPRRKVDLADGSTIKIRVGNLHS